MHARARYGIRRVAVLDPGGRGRGGRERGRGRDQNDDRALGSGFTARGFCDIEPRRWLRWLQREGSRPEGRSHARNRFVGSRLFMHMFASPPPCTSPRPRRSGREAVAVLPMRSANKSDHAPPSLIILVSPTNPSPRPSRTLSRPPSLLPRWLLLHPLPPLLPPPLLPPPLLPLPPPPPSRHHTYGGGGGDVLNLHQFAFYLPFNERQKLEFSSFEPGKPGYRVERKWNQ